MLALLHGLIWLLAMGALVGLIAAMLTTIRRATCWKEILGGIES